MPQFSPDQVVFGDGAGARVTGMSPTIASTSNLSRCWRSERLPVLISDYDFLQMLTADGSTRRAIARRDS